MSTMNEAQGRAGFINRRVLAWAAWDMGSSSFASVVTTFVFATYLTNKDIFGPQANSQLGWATAMAGIAVALIAPAIGQWTDRTGKTRTVLIVSTVGISIIMACLFFVRPEKNYLWLGLLLLGVGNFVIETGSVIYHSLVSEVSTPKTVGRVSGFGWGMGYIGTIFLLLILLFAFIQPEVGLFGVTHDDAMHVRVSMIGCAVWTIIFCLPLLLTSRNRAAVDPTHRGIFGAYRELFISIVHYWRTDRSVVWFLISSAIFRDGLAGVFAFGGVLAGTVYGFSATEVMYFAIAANLIAGLATLVFGQLDDRIGARKVIIGSLVSMCFLGLGVFWGAEGGKTMFWIFGLGLCVFVGPTQAAARSYLARIAPKGEEGKIFGLYATAGRAVSFLAPLFYATAITAAAAMFNLSEDAVAEWGVLGIVLVLLLGLLSFFPVKSQERVH